MKPHEMTTSHLKNSISWHEDHIVELIDEFYVAIDYEYTMEALSGNGLSSRSDILQRKINLYTKKLKELKNELSKRKIKGE